jgi:hypothetical protein
MYPLSPYYFNGQIKGSWMCRTRSMLEMKREHLSMGLDYVYVEVKFKNVNLSPSFN